MYSLFNYKVRIFEELLSSASSFMHLYNRVFFKSETNSLVRSKRRLSLDFSIASDAQQGYELLKPSAESQEHPAGDDEAALDEAIATSLGEEYYYIWDATIQNPTFGPYPEKFVILNKANNLIKALRNQKKNKGESCQSLCVNRESSRLRGSFICESVVNSNLPRSIESAAAKTSLLISNTEELRKELSALAFL